MRVTRPPRPSAPARGLDPPFLEGASLDQPRPSPLLEADVDDIEVPRDLGPRKDGAGLVGNLACEVAAGEVRQRDKRDLGGTRDLRGVGRRRVRGLLGTRSLVFAEGRLVDEQVGRARGLEDRPRRGGVPRQHDLAARPRLAQHHVRRDDGTVGERHRVAPLQSPALRPGRHAERIRRLDVEAPGARRLHERVADGGNAVVDGKGAELVAVTRDDVPRPELDERVLVREPAEDAAQRGEELAQPPRAVDRDRQLPAAERERLQHPGQAEIVVGVVVRQEDVRELGKPDRRAEQLALRPLAAVEQQPLTLAADQQRSRRALRGRHRAGRAEEDDVEIHASILRAGLTATGTGRPAAGPDG
jgi:hypothetical protein